MEILGFLILFVVGGLILFGIFSELRESVEYRDLSGIIKYGLILLVIISLVSFLSYNWYIKTSIRSNFHQYITSYVETSPYKYNYSNNLTSFSKIVIIDKKEKIIHNYHFSLPEDRKAKKTKKIYLDAVRRHNPDIIIINDIDAYWLHPQIEEGIPTIAIAHEPLVRDIRYLAWWKGMQKFIDAGGHLYFVSAYQQKFHEFHVERVTGYPLIGVKGTINSGFATGNEIVDKLSGTYDAVTIGRTDLTKNPFILHKKLQSTNLSSCVLTNKENFR